MRIPPIDENNPPLILRPIFAIVRRKLGKVPTPSKVWAHRPWSIFWFSLFMNNSESSKLLPDQTKRLVCLRAAQLIGCVF